MVVDRGAYQAKWRKENVEKFSEEAPPIIMGWIAITAMVIGAWVTLYFR